MIHNKTSRNCSQQHNSRNVATKHLWTEYKILFILHTLYIVNRHMLFDNDSCICMRATHGLFYERAFIYAHSDLCNYLRLARTARKDNSTESRIIHKKWKHPILANSLYLSWVLEFHANCKLLTILKTPPDISGVGSRVASGDQKTATWTPRPPFMVARAVLPQTGSAGVRYDWPVTTPTTRLLSASTEDSWK